MFTTVCDFNSKLFRIEITESINIAQNLITNFNLVPCFRIYILCQFNEFLIFH